MLTINCKGLERSGVQIHGRKCKNVFSTGGGGGGGGPFMDNKVMESHGTTPMFRQNRASEWLEWLRRACLMLYQRTVDIFYE